MPPAVRALRGATTVDADTEEQVTERVQALLRRDARAQRRRPRRPHQHPLHRHRRHPLHVPGHRGPRPSGLGDVPLLCARELDVDGGTPLCIRVLMHLNTDRARAELHHVYLEGARGLRDDLPELSRAAAAASSAPG